MDSLVIDKIVVDVLSTKKYRYIYEPTIRRTVEELATRYPEKRLEKEVRKKLHQLWGAYITRPNFIKLQSEVVSELAAGANPKDVMLPILRLQSSTEERLPIIDTLYGEIVSKLSEVGINLAEIKSIVEYGAGMNALTYPWISESFGEQVSYTAIDVDSELATFQNHIFEAMGSGDHAKSIQGDILSDELIDGDLTFLFKLLPLLEHQEKGGAKRVLEQIRSRVIVVSFPTRSIGGRKKGMGITYSEYILSLAKAVDKKVVELRSFEGELLFLIH